MQLTINYRNGSTRVVNVISDFFRVENVKDRYKTMAVSPEQKCMDIALDGGSRPYSIVLMEGSDVVYKHTDKGNMPPKPEKVEEWRDFMSQQVTEKEMKELRKTPLTRRWVAGTEGLSWKRGIELLLGHIK